MARSKELSPTMRTALNVAFEHGALERWKGGYWTYPKCESERTDPEGDPIPSWHVGVQTIMALVDRGYLEITRTTKLGLSEVKPTGVLPS